MSYVVLDGLNDYRYKEHLEDNLKGTLFLINRGISRQSEETQERWLTLISKLTGSRIGLKQHTQSLKSEKPKIRALANGGYAFQTALQSDNTKTLTLEFEGLTESLITTTAFLLLNDLGRHPPTARQEVFDLIRDQLPYAVFRSTKSKKVLNRKQISRLDRGEVVIHWGKQFDRSNWLKVYAPWGKTGDVLVLGPIAMFDPYPLEILIPVCIVAMVLITITVFLLIRRLSKRLLVVQKTVDTIDADYFGEVPEAAADDAIGMLNYKIHQMMTRIKKLMDDQAYMIRAISHDLRTPISRLHFRLESVQNDLGDEDSMISACKSDLDQLNHLIDELLTYEKLTHERLPEFQPIKFIELAGHSVRNLSELHNDIALNLVVQIPQDTISQGNELLIKRLLENLIQNACKYAKSQVVVSVEQKSSQLVCTIDDDGPGIEPKSQINLFSPFFRADDSRNKQSGGYGLGLAIAKQITLQHQGQISATNNSWGGARFVFSIALNPQINGGPST